MTSETNETAAGATETRLPESGGVFEWLWRNRAIEAARLANEPALSTFARRRHRQAVDLANAGDQALRLRSGGPRPVAALVLYREAARLAAEAIRDRNGAQSLEEAMNGLDPALRASAAPTDEHRRALFSDLAADDDPERERLYVERAREVVTKLLATLAQRPDVQRLLWQRFSRTAFLAAITLSAVVLVSFGALARRHPPPGPDLAKGKHWRASSAYGGYHVSGSLDAPHLGAPLFHTEEEDGPWFEIDLGSPQPVHRVDVHNRRDCCAHRASPLVIETRVGAEPWVEVARRESTFDDFEAEFPRRDARYIRLRVAKKSMLHLDSVEVY